MPESRCSPVSWLISTLRLASSLRDLAHDLDELREVAHVLRLDRDRDDRLGNVADLLERDHVGTADIVVPANASVRPMTAAMLPAVDLLDHEALGAHEEGDVLDPVLRLRAGDLELHALLECVRRTDRPVAISPAFGSIVMSVTMNERRPVGVGRSAIAIPIRARTSPFQMFGIRYFCATWGLGKMANDHVEDDVVDLRLLRDLLRDDRSRRTR